MKRIIFLMLCFTLLCGCSSQKNKDNDSTTLESPIKTASELTDAISMRHGYEIHTAVVYSELEDTDHSWEHTLEYLIQPLVLNLSADGVNVDECLDFSSYDILYLDDSLLLARNVEQICQKIEEFTHQGGAVFVPNSFADFFPKDYLGISSFVKLEMYPEKIEFLENAKDLYGIQTIIGDFHSLYADFSDERIPYDFDYGYAFVPNKAVALVSSGENALYTLNRYGAGYVFLTNPLLPNAYCQSSFFMEPQDKDQTAFSSTASSCNQLLLNAYASFISKQLYGFSLERIFGTYGSPSMSWELHYEEITGIANDSLQKFSQLCREQRQIPSFTLIRNSYRWFLRSESLTYFMNQSQDGTLSYCMDYNENAYSSGTHIANGDKWLSLESINEGGSYFNDYPEYNYRLFPVALDYEGDGNMDFFCGSANGQIYYFHGLGFSGKDGRLATEEACLIRDLEGNPISIGSYSAPALFDIDGDGLLDLISGSSDGKLYWYRGNGTTAFLPEGILLETDISGQCLPAASDVNGDGIEDLMVGSDQGILLLYYGQRDGNNTFFSRNAMCSYTKLCADQKLGNWLSPCLNDLDGDGISELALGTFDGYIGLFKYNENFVFDDFLTISEMNYKGNYNLKCGNYVTPVFTDLNGDGRLDLLCGSLEYGLAYPIDSDYFPYKEKLQEQVDYARDNHLYMGMHFYTNAYASAEREAYELAAHRKALDAFGIELDGIGANQHTWYTSRMKSSQTMESIYHAGLLWESGFAPSNAAFTAPQIAAENVISMPFFLSKDGDQILLVQNSSILPYCDTNWSDISGKYGVPVCAYYHCDFIYESDTEAREYISKLSEFQWKFGYNFMKEDQLMRASAAAYNLRVTVRPDGNCGFSIIPESISKEFPLYDDATQKASGLKIAFSTSVEDEFYTDSPVYKVTEDALAVGLPGAVRVFVTEEKQTVPHIQQINVPADITCNADGAEIAFIGDGMMQVVVFGAAKTDCIGWDTETKDGKTIFTKYGSADILNITYKEDK